MSPAWTNWRLWRRIALVGSVGWSLIIMLIYGLRNHFYMRWGPASADEMWVAVILGVVAIVVACFGIPWVASAARQSSE